MGAQGYSVTMSGTPHESGEGAGNAARVLVGGTMGGTQPPLSVHPRPAGSSPDGVSHDSDATTASLVCVPEPAGTCELTLRTCTSRRGALGGLPPIAPCAYCE